MHIPYISDVVEQSFQKNAEGIKTLQFLKRTYLIRNERDYSRLKTLQESYFCTAVLLNIPLQKLSFPLFLGLALVLILAYFLVARRLLRGIESVEAPPIPKVPYIKSYVSGMKKLRKRYQILSLLGTSLCGAIFLWGFFLDGLSPLTHLIDVLAFAYFAIHTALNLWVLLTP